MDDIKADLTEKKIDILWEAYKLFDEESGRLEKEMLRCFIYAAVVIAIPFGVTKLGGDKNIGATIEKTKRLVPFAIILVYYYYLTLMYFVICISIYKSGIEKKINDLVGDSNFINYNSLFTDKIYSKVLLPIWKKRLIPSPNLILAFLILGAIITVTFSEDLLPAGGWSIVFYLICGFTVFITLYVFFHLSEVVKKDWDKAQRNNCMN